MLLLLADAVCALQCACVSLYVLLILLYFCDMLAGLHNFREEFEG